jgi:hypothetical protein
MPLSQTKIIFIDLITIVIFGDHYRSYSSKLGSLLLSPITLSPWSNN